MKVYFTQDLLLPVYSNHTIPQTFLGGLFHRELHLPLTP